ncbi:MAG: SLC13 family permease, partial [Clostridia bacterium]|nr:SLC13 family permease [Clostridia bacterium]
FGTLSDRTAITYIATFILAAALGKTEFLSILGKAIVAKAKSELHLMISFAAVTAVLSFFMAGPALCVILGPAILSMCREAKVSPKRFWKPMNDIYCVWGALIPVGGAVAIYMSTNTLIESYGGNPTMTLWTIPLAQLPIAIAATIYIIFSFKFMPTDWDGIDEGKIISQADKMIQKDLSNRVEHKWQQTVIYIAYVGTMLGIVTSAWTGFAVPLVSAIGALLVVATGAMSDKEAINAVNWPIICLYGGGVAVANGLKTTGGIDLLGNALQGFLGGFSSPWLIGAIVFALALFTTQFVNNNIAKSLFGAITVPLAVAMGWDARALYVMGFLGANMAVTFPMGSNTASTVYGLGAYKTSDFIKQGWPTLLIILIVGAAVIPMIYPIF